MINTMDKLMNAFALLLDGNLSYNSINVPVYKEDIPEDWPGSHYVLLSAEGETDASNKRSFATDSVVTVDIVTIFRNNVDRSVAGNIDGQILNLVLPDKGSTSGLAVQTGFQILNVFMETSAFIHEYDQGEKTAIYRKVSRYKILAYQTA